MTFPVEVSIPPNPVEVFVVYAREDLELKEELIPHLAVLQRTGLIALWHDGMIPAGADWERELFDRLQHAEVVLLLVSANFARSDFCTQKEAVKAIQRHRARQCVVIPVLVRPVADWQQLRIDGTPLGEIQAIPRDGKTISALGDDGWVMVSDAIRQALRAKLPTAVTPPIVPRGIQLSRGQNFVDRLAHADEVIVVGLTNENIVRHLEKALQIRRVSGRDFWSQLTVVFASKSFLETLPEERSASGAVRSATERLNRLFLGRSLVVRFLLAQGEAYRDRWTCREYPGPLPFVGCLFRQGDTSTLRIAMVLPGIDLKDAFFIELESGSTPFFEQIYRTLEMVCNSSRQLTEWILRGTVSDQHTYTINGLVKRTRVDSAIGACLPVVLVMLNLRAAHGRVSLLQKRTPYNAVDGIGKYSNLSGWIIDLDLLTALGITPTSRYLAEPERQSSDEDAWRRFVELTGRGPVEVALDFASASVCLMTYEAAARREVYEELGLQRDEVTSALAFQRHFLLPKSKGPDLLFGIFSLELTSDQLAEVRLRRPYVELHPFTCEQLIRAHDNEGFNRLLQVRFRELFLPIFQSLSICGQ